MNNPSPNPVSKIVVLALAGFATVFGCNQKNLVGQVDGGQDTGSSPGSGGTTPSGISGVSGQSTGGNGVAGTTGVAGVSATGGMGAPIAGISGAAGAAGMVGAMGQCPYGLYRTPPPDPGNGAAGTRAATFDNIADPTASTPFPIAPPTDYPTPQGTFSMAVGDVNADGKPDIVTGGFNVMGVLLNKGGGTFSVGDSYPVNNGGYVELGDVTGDGKPDIVVVNADVFVFTGKGDGTFITPIAAANRNPANGLYDPSLVDVNLDGKLDLVAIGYAGEDTVVEVMFNEGGGTFDVLKTSTAGKHGIALAVGFMDGDTCHDFVVANAVDDALTLVLGNCGGGTLGTRTMRTGGHPVGVAIGRLDKTASTWDLLASINNRADVDVFRGKPAAGTFDPIVRYDAGAGTRGIALGDLNGDGHTDAVVALLGGIGVLLNKGDGTFAAPRTALSPCGPRDPSGGGAMGLADFDGDGKLDVALTTSVLSFVTIFLNRL